MFDEDNGIFPYTRRHAIVEGVLVDVGETASLFFKVPVALTHSLQEELTPTKWEMHRGQSYAERLQDVLRMAHLAWQRSNENAYQISFTVRIMTFSPVRHRCKLYLWLLSDMGEDGELSLTIGFPEDFRRS